MSLLRIDIRVTLARSRWKWKIYLTGDLSPPRSRSRVPFRDVVPEDPVLIAVRQRHDALLPDPGAELRRGDLGDQELVEPPIEDEPLRSRSIEGPKRFSRAGSILLGDINDQ